MIAAWRTVNEVRSMATRTRIPPDEEDATGEPRRDNGPGSEQLVLDAVAEQYADDGGRHEGDDQAAEQLSPVDVAADDAARELTESAPIEHDDGKDRADLDRDRIGVGGGLGVTFAEAEQTLGHQEVTGGGHREVLGEPLDRPEHDRLDRGERAARVQREQDDGDDGDHRSGSEPRVAVPANIARRRGDLGVGHQTTARRERSTSRPTGTSEIVTITMAAISRLCLTTSTSPR